MNCEYRRAEHPLMQMSFSSPVDDSSRLISLWSKERAGNGSWAERTRVPKTLSMRMPSLGTLNESISACWKCEVRTV